MSSLCYISIQQIINNAFCSLCDGQKDILWHFFEAHGAVDTDRSSMLLHNFFLLLFIRSQDYHQLSHNHFLYLGKLLHIGIKEIAGPTFADISSLLLTNVCTYISHAVFYMPISNKTIDENLLGKFTIFDL
jgi:hypothetical protein